MDTKKTLFLDPFSRPISICGASFLLLHLWLRFSRCRRAAGRCLPSAAEAEASVPVLALVLVAQAEMPTPLRAQRQHQRRRRRPRQQR